ncbi:hypothetical protein I4W93_011075 [Rheinheimera sp. MA13]|uniref:Uncharacterized protein n=1 Tax=Rheinheimera maricola TaxID=2793282 RepID=A0ABS7XAM9_9GAMM|nr:hypothetical protein [Rheinheimera maricola]MBZ9612135.1 hypothetical protein [Rheinheimera maricola]
MQKLPVPNITLETQDQGSVFQTKMNSLANACKTAVQAYNNQIDAATTAEQFSDAAQQALADADVTPILRQLNLLTIETPSISLDFQHGHYFAYVAGAGVNRYQLSELMQTVRDTPAISNGLLGFENIPSHTPMIEVDPVSREIIGLKSAAVRVNKLLKSNNFADSKWVKSGVTTSELTATPLIEGAKIWKISETSVFGVHYITQSILLEANKIYTIVVVAKAAERQQLSLQTSSTINWLASKSSRVNLLDSTVIDGEGKATQLYDGFTEFSLTAQFGSVGGNGGVNLYLSKDGVNSYQGDGVSGIEIFTVDLVEGPIAGPPIITDTTSLATSSDKHSLPVTHRGSFTIYGEFIIYDFPVDTFAAICRLADADNTSTRGAAIRIGRTSGGTITAAVAVRGADGILTSIPATNQSDLRIGINRLAMSFDALSNELSISLNGVTNKKQVDSADFLELYATHLYPISRINITSSNTNPETVRCRRCIFWPYTLSTESQNKWTLI